MPMMRQSLTRKRRDERGVYAVFFGLLVLLLASVAALAVDIGNAVARKGDVQAQADFAALAAGAQLDDNGGIGPIPDAVLDEARALLNKNRALNWGDDCSSGPVCIADNAQLINGNPDDGEARWTSDGLEVVTPQETVTYGLAKVMGFDDVDVQGTATVRIGSFGFMSIPAYAVNPCDYGRQVLTDPASGHAIPAETPPLEHDTQSNSTTLDSITPSQVDANADATQPQPQISLKGQKFVRSTHIGFFNASGDFHTYQLTPRVNQNGVHTITGIVVPLAVTSSEEVWYVRVLNDEANTPTDELDDRWSSSDEAVPLRVGNAVLECDSDVFGGNFGTIRMDRNDEEGEELARNFAEGFEDPINVVPHVPANGSTPVVGGICFHDDPFGSVESSESNNPVFIGFNSNTDCVTTDPGLPANAVADGLVRGGSGFAGRLTNKPTRSGCSPDNGSGLLRVNIQGNYDINNEVLSCYLTDPSMPVSEIARAGYNSGPALHSDIWDSPRFTLVPVLGVQPATGLDRYSVVSLRPAFITDESTSSTRHNSDATGTGSSCTEFCNGLRIDGNDITQLTVIFFNIDALPPNPDGDIIDYLGDGPKAVQLVD